LFILENNFCYRRKMTKQTWLNISNYTAIIFASWFFITGWFWAYLAALIIAWPAGVLGMIFWLIGKKSEKKIPNKIAGYILLAGAGTSITALIILMIYN
jgi:hypothetical protein